MNIFSIRKTKANYINHLHDFIKKAPVLSVINAIKLCPYEHDKSLYYYRFMLDGKEYRLCVDDTRQQWYIDDKNHGDDAASLLSFLYMSCDAQFLGFSLIDAYIIRIVNDLNKAKKTPQRIPLKPLPLDGGTWIAKRYDKAINMPFLQGLCDAVLKNHCYVVYLANCATGNVDKETNRLFSLIQDTKDLKELPQEDRDSIKEKFSTVIALRNVNGGLQLYDGECSYPLKSEGYCLLGGEKLLFGDKLYVYENIMDYLALMEQRHANGVDTLMASEQHFIINGERNLSEALAYIQDRCDYLQVVSMLPNDEKGRDLFERVNNAAFDTAEDASQRLYADKNYFSLYAQTADIFGYVDREACERELKQCTI